MLPTISRRSLFTGMMKSRRTLYIGKKKERKRREGISIPCRRPPRRSVLPYTYIHARRPTSEGAARGPKRRFHVPFLARGNAPHTVQPVQYRLQTRQDRTIKLDGERALQARLVLRLLEQILQLEEFDLQMQLPMNQKKISYASKPNGGRRRTYIAMNSSTESFSLRGSNAVSSVGCSSSASATSTGFSAENELDATRRVYSQPMFRQNLCKPSKSASVQEQWQERPKRRGRG